MVIADPLEAQKTPIHLEICLTKEFSASEWCSSDNLRRIEGLLLEKLKKYDVICCRYISIKQLQDEGLDGLQNKVEYLYFENNCLFNAPASKSLTPNSGAKKITPHQQMASERKTDFEVKKAMFITHIYSLHLDVLEEASKETGGGTIGRQWRLPNQSFEFLWETLTYNGNIKDVLLNYANTLLMFAEKGVSGHLISTNKTILLYGPSGTGKSSLCQALAQKLAIRLSGKYKSARLVEINANSLLSKYFSESCKLVQDIFNRLILLLRENSHIFVCILLDEVESIAMSRSKSISGSEPSDAVRVVNVLLTQLDQLKRFSNVLVLMTSNMESFIDSALLDRVDLKIYVEPPNFQARKQICLNFIEELLAKGVLLASPSAQLEDPLSSPKTEEFRLLHLIVERLEGASGRRIKKLPFIVFSSYIQTKESTLLNFLQKMIHLVNQEKYLDSE